MKAWCHECGDEFHCDSSTGDGEFCSWECSDAYGEREDHALDYDLAYGPKESRRLSGIRSDEFEERVAHLRR